METYYSSFLPLSNLPPISEQDLSWSRQMVQRPNSLLLPTEAPYAQYSTPNMDIYSFYPYSASVQDSKIPVFSPQDPDSGYSTAVTTPTTPPPPGFPPMVSVVETTAETIRTCNPEPTFAQICEKLLPYATPDASSSSSSSKILITPPGSTNYVGYNVMFWIENRPGVNFEVRVSGPDGRLECAIFLDLSLGKFCINFTPRTPGNYTVEVSYLTPEDIDPAKGWNPTPPPPTEPEPITFNLDGRGIKMGKDRVHLPGSPFVVPVHRNFYESAMRNPIVRVDMELDFHENTEEARALMKSGDPDLVVTRKPWGLAVNPVSQMIYVTDREQHHILIYNHDGSPVYAFGGYGRNTGEFRRPCGIAFDMVLDRLYVTDKDNHRVQVFTSLGVFLFTFGSRGKKCGQFAFPWGIDVNRVGTLIVVADSRNHRLQMFNEHGGFVRKIADRGVYFDYPRGVAFDPTGQYVFSTDFNLHHVLCTDIEFKHRCRVIVSAEELNRPQSIHVDPTGQLIVTSASDNNIKVFDAWTGNALYELSNIGQTPLDLPLNAVTLRGGYLAILEMNGKLNII